MLLDRVIGFILLLIIVVIYKYFFFCLYNKKIFVGSFYDVNNL